MVIIGNILCLLYLRRTSLLFLDGSGYLSCHTMALINEYVDLVKLFAKVILHNITQFYRTVLAKYIFFYHFKSLFFFHDLIDFFYEFLNKP